MNKPSLLGGLAGLLIAVSLGLPAAVAHEGAAAWIYVPAPSVAGGQPFELWGSDLGPRSSVSIHATVEDEVYPIGTVTAGDDGHFTTTLVMPVEVPSGYVELSAIGDDGSVATVWVLVGEAGAFGAPMREAANPLADPSVLVLGGMLVIGTALLAYVVLRRRSPTPAAAPARASRRQVARKRQRADPR